MNTLNILISIAALTGLYYLIATFRQIDRAPRTRPGWWIMLIGTAVMTGTVLRATIFLLCLVN